MRKPILALALFCLMPLQWAQAEYFTVSESTKNIESSWTEFHTEKLILPPWEVFEHGLVQMRNELENFASTNFPLLNFVSHQGNYGETTERYSRAKHFGTWIRDPKDGTCLNTRGTVLVRDSLTSVSYSSNGCTVAMGQWIDPYSGRTYSRSSDIQVDHFVPLKNAFISGASDWNAKRRCLYANFLGNEFHLLAVAGSENQRKSDRSPEGYMPPNSAYKCQYLAQWMKVKMIWQLNFSPSEKESIVSLVQENHCDIKQFVFAANDLAGQRDFIAKNMDLCRR